ncbi:MAG: flagellar biosynthesis anti-sigma factor FlgM [Vibrionaceae bacterium]|nr:flagellar biosynthesis anti-sigma factor FlgM [Vibrionaceae bacterium]
MAGIDNIRSGQMMTTNKSRAPARHDSNATSAAESQKVSSQKDAVSLSQQSKDVNKLQKDMAASPAYDSAKVAAIKEAIANGSYKVDPEKLADNMIKLESELQGKS